MKGRRLTKEFFDLIESKDLSSTYSNVFNHLFYVAARHQIYYVADGGLVQSSWDNLDKLLSNKDLQQIPVLRLLLLCGVKV